MTPKPTQLALSRVELDAMIGDIANRRAPILPILRRVRDGEIAYAELRYAGARILRLGPPGSLPMVALVADGEGRGPDGFPRAGFLRHLLGRANAVLLVCDEQPDDLAYEVAAAHAAESRRHVIIVETHRQSLPDWVSFARAAGCDEGNVVAFTADPDRPAGLERIDLDEFAKAPPRGPVH